MTRITQLEYGKVDILAMCRERKYIPIDIRETDGQYTVYVNSRKGVTDATLAKRFADSPLRVVGHGWEDGRHYILLRVR